MLRAIICIAIAIVAATMPGTSTEARGKQQGKLAEAPLKDCTRLNGRWGYYGNPWCTPAEQLRWDRWDAQRR
jgi:hypothetical protein